MPDGWAVEASENTKTYSDAVTTIDENTAIVSSAADAIELIDSGDQTINVGENSTLLAVSLNEGDGATAGINKSTGALTLGGSGNIIAIGGSAAQNSYGVYGIDGVALSGNVTAIGGSSRASSYGVGGGNIDFSGNVTAIGGAAETNSAGVYSSGNVALSGKTTAIGGAAEGYSLAIRGNYCSVSEDAEVIAIGGAAGLDSCGILVSYSISVSGGALLAAGATKAMDEAPTLTASAVLFPTDYDPDLIDDYKLILIEPSINLYFGNGPGTGDAGGWSLYIDEGLTTKYTGNGGKWSADAPLEAGKPAKLTLNGFEFETAHADTDSAWAALRLKADTEIVLEEGTENSIVSTYSGDSISVGILSDLKLTISGSGSLYVKSGETEDRISSYGIFGRGDVTISDAAQVTAVGGTAAKADSCGISGAGVITISGEAQVTATGGKAGNGKEVGIGVGKSDGICGYGKITISGEAKVNATGGEALWSHGIFAGQGGTLTISGNARVTAIGSGAWTDSIGIHVSGTSGTISITGGTVTANNAVPSNPSASICPVIDAHTTLTVGAPNYVMSIENAKDSGDIKITKGDGALSVNKLFKINDAPIVIKKNAPFIEPEPGPIPGQTKPTTPPASEPWVNPFTDVSEGDWWYEAVKYCNENGIMNGVSHTEFKPTGIVTRAEVWQVLMNMVQLPSDTTKTPWYTDAQAWAMRVGVTDGTNPTEEVTREQLATMLFRFYMLFMSRTYEGGAMGMAGFEDVVNISDWAYEGFSWAVHTGVIEGSEGKLNPLGDASRAELATMLMRLDKLLKG